MRPALVRRLHRFFVGQARRVLAQYLAEFLDSGHVAPLPPAAEELLPDSERSALWLAVLPFLLQAILNALDLAGQIVGLQPLEQTDPRVQRLLHDARLQFAGVHATTLDAIRATLAEGFRMGYSPRQIAYGVPQDGFTGLAHTVAETYVNRSQTITRTTIATLRQNAAVERYQEAGVSAVHVLDGYDCGWSEHDDPDKASGTMRLMHEAMQYPIGHPNCSRIFLPLR